MAKTKSNKDDLSFVTEDEQRRGKLRILRDKSILGLEPMEREFCFLVSQGVAHEDAARRAGYAEPAVAAKTLRQRQPILRALRVLYDRNVEMSEFTREDVLAGFQDAIGIARQQSDAGTMIAGFREIGRMLGMYETKVKVEISTDPNQMQKQISNMSDDQLMDAIRKRSAVLNRTLDSASAEDAEFTEA